MSRPFLKHQLGPATWAEDRPFAPIFMDMRLGKCKVVIHRAQQRAAKRILLVAPIEAQAGWQRELKAEGESFVVASGSAEERIRAVAGAHEKWGTGHRYFVITNHHGLFEPAGKRPCPECQGKGHIEEWNDGGGLDGTITCWRCAGKKTVKGTKAEPTDLATLPYDAIVWDESTVLKNPKSQVAKIAIEMGDRIPDRAILSGEFAPEDATNIFMQMRFCLGSFMGHTNFWDWRDEFFQQFGFEWMPKPGTLKKIHEELSKYAYRLTSHEAGTYVAPKRQKIVVELPSRLRRMVDSAMRDMEIMDDETGQIISTTQTMVVGGWIAQLAGGYPKFAPTVRSDHKMKAFVDFVVGLKGAPFVATFRFNNELDAAYDALLTAAEGTTKVGQCACVTGDVPAKDRMNLEKMFKDGVIQGMLMQVKVARFGIDLSTADWMLRYSLPYSWEEVSQPMMRIVHPLKKRPVTYVDFVCRNTTDEDVYAASLTKKDGARGFMRDLQESITARILKGQSHGQVSQVRRSVDAAPRRAARGTESSPRT